MGGIREFNCACLIVSLLLALLPNTSATATLLRIIAWSLQHKLYTSYCLHLTLIMSTVEQY
jgi:hypothetical protein